MPGWKQYSHLYVLAALAAYILLIGNHLISITDPVESNYVETASEMIRKGDYFSPQIFGNYWYDKPIFFYWELIAAFQLFGTNEFAARFFPAMFGIAGILLAYGFASYLYDKKTGLITAFILLTTVEYFYISKAVITDMTLFVTYSATLISFYIAYTEKKSKWYYIAYICAGISVLTKGPIGLLQPGLIIIVFLLWRHDIKALFHIKMISGLSLFFVITALWYGPMYIMHDGDFVSQFIGVHNILRATVSEHPKYNVWYYYTVIFILGFIPWVFTLPLAYKKYGWRKSVPEAVRTIFLKRTLPQCSIKQQFLITWALVIFITYQCMATKYVTYTFPYMIPVAIGFASYLKDREKLVTYMTAGCFIVYTVLTFFVAVPFCRNASAVEAAQTVDALGALNANTKIVTYGGRYPVSFAFYSGFEAYRLAPAADIPGLLPGGIGWNAKNVMPFMAIEDLPRDVPVLALIHKNEASRFLEHVPGDWVQISQEDSWIIYRLK